MFNRSSPFYDDTRALMGLADKGQFVLATSTTVLIEALGQSPNVKVNEQVEAVILQILDSPRIRPVEFSRRVALYARDLVLRKKMPKWDAIHLASAVEAKVDVFFTTDNDHPIGEKHDGVWVDFPYLPGVDQQTLFGDSTGHPGSP